MEPSTSIEPNDPTATDPKDIEALIAHLGSGKLSASEKLNCFIRPLSSVTTLRLDIPPLSQKTSVIYPEQKLS